MPPTNSNDAPAQPFALNREEAAGEATPGVSLVGQVERITFANEENGFAIAKLYCEEQRETVTVKGTLGAIREGESLKVWGVWEEHPVYGPQLAVQSSPLLGPAMPAHVP